MAKTSRTLEDTGGSLVNHEIHKTHEKELH